MKTNVQIKDQGFYVNNLFGKNFYVNLDNYKIYVSVEGTICYYWQHIKTYYDNAEITGIIEAIFYAYEHRNEEV